MRHALILDLAAGTEFRQSVEARPPRIVHGTVLLLGALLGVALAWAALTRADLVVRASGRVRPVQPPQKVYNHARGEVLSASAGARVVEVCCRPGDEVKKGDVLVRLDTSRMVAEIAKLRRTAAAGEEELAQGLCLKELVALQYEGLRDAAQAELENARDEINRAKAQQAADLRILKVELRAAEDVEARTGELAGRGAAAQAEYVQVMAHLHEVKAKIIKAEIPVDEGRLKVVGQRLGAAKNDCAIKLKEMEVKRGTKQAEVAAARKELEMLEQERDRAVLVAPTDGVVTLGEVKVGDVLKPGEAVLEVAERQGFCFEVVVSSEEVGRLAVGMPVRIKLDAFDYQRYGTAEGTVVYISPDSGASEGQRAPVYVVKVTVEGDEVGRGAYRGQIKLGMAGQAEVVTGRETLLSLLLKKIRQSISLG